MPLNVCLAFGFRSNPFSLGFAFKTIVTDERAVNPQREADANEAYLIHRNTGGFNGFHLFGFLEDGLQSIASYFRAPWHRWAPLCVHLLFVVFLGTGMYRALSKR